MLDRFDSRALGRTDCYAQRFMKPGVYPYAIVPVGTQRMTDRRPFVVRVAEGAVGQQLAQRTLRISAKHGRFSTDAEVTIQPGDVVMWNCPDASAPPYAVIGAKPFFSSARLANGCGFTHAFGHPGDYHWIDVYGSGLEGVVHVRSPRLDTPEQAKRWQASLAQGTLVTISGTSAEPRAVEVEVGQTVFFSVTQSRC